MTFLPIVWPCRYEIYHFISADVTDFFGKTDQFLLPFRISQFLGTFALWFGWYGFNPGSASLISSANRGEVAALAAVNTTLAACAGAVSAMFTSTLWEYVTIYIYVDVWNGRLSLC